MPCASLHAPKGQERLAEVLRIIENEGIEGTVGTYTILVDAASAAKDIGKVESLFDETKRKNVVGDFYFYTAVINALIDGYCRLP